MKAVVLAAANRFEVRDDVPRPTAERGQALVRVQSSTVCGTDAKIFAGLFPGTKFPHIPGHEFSGEVVEVGAGVDEVAVGDRVGVEVHVGCGQCARCLEGLYQLCVNYGRADKGHAHIGFTAPGGLAEYTAVSVKALHKLPERLSWDEGAFCDNIGIALYAVERGRLRAGERVLVIGAGAFGALAVQVARAMGAARVVLLGTRWERVARLAGLADAVVVGTGDDAIQQARAALRGDGGGGDGGGGDGGSGDGGRGDGDGGGGGRGDGGGGGRGDRGGGDGADLVIEFAGSSEAARQAILLARRGGRVVLAGSTGPGRELCGIDLSTIVRGHLDIYGSLANSRGISRRGLELMARGAIDVGPLITDHFTLDQFPEAWATFVERRGGAIRVMLHP